MHRCAATRSRVTGVATRTLSSFTSANAWACGEEAVARRYSSSSVAAVQTKVTQMLQSNSKVLYSPKAITEGVQEFLGFDFDGSYLTNNGPEDVAVHANAYLNALSESRGAPSFNYGWVEDNRAVFISARTNEDTSATMKAMDNWINARKARLPKEALSVRSFSSRSGKAVDMYLLNLEPFTDPSGKTKTLAGLSSAAFMRKSEGARKRYETMLGKLEGAIKPVTIAAKLADGTTVLNIGLHAVEATSMMSLNTLIKSINPNVTIQKKFLESFSNGAQVYSFYVKGVEPKEAEDAASMVALLPNRPGHVYTDLYNKGALDAHQVVYAFSVSQFAYYFAKPTQDGNFSELARGVRKDEQLLQRLKNLRNTMFQDIMDESSMSVLVDENLDLFKEIYADFAKGTTAESEAALRARIDKDLPESTSPQANALFNSFVTFNKSVKATNFFKSGNAAVSYRFDPAFIGALDYPRVPYAVYMIVGSQFRGFHVRFHDIARGGVRMMLSANRTVYKNKRKTMFQENYNLAYTQMLKNKDIPESGSKGTLLVSTRFDQKRFDKKVLFLQYVDSLLDIMLADKTPGVRTTLPTRELLFLGPDENTADDYPSAAALHAKSRNMNEWEVLTTGKGAADGGIPHDHYGMTTTSVREFVKGIYRKRGETESKLTKFMTGGPKGDLGSNEILMATEKIIGICDATGCAHDPNGIDRDELVRLAKNRFELDQIDVSKLSKNGFFLPTKAPKTTLPDGSSYTGVELLRIFHFTKYTKADVFVPCGGLPNSVTLDTVAQFVAQPGVTGTMLYEGAVQVDPAHLKYKYIVEGANLFISHDARIALENAGVVLYKDAMANKGGVTSSSFEVYAGLCMNEEEHARLMCCKEGIHKPTPFYEAYAKEVVARVTENARVEFEAVNADAEKGYLGGKRTLIGDAYSRKMVEIFEFVTASDLCKDETLFRYVLWKYTPKTLLNNGFTIDKILKQAPLAYLQAIFHKQIASQFVYSAGIAANEFSFYQYMTKLKAEAEQAKKEGKF